MDCDNVSLVRSRILRKRSTRCASLPSMSRIRTDTTRSPSPSPSSWKQEPLPVSWSRSLYFSGVKNASQVADDWKYVAMVLDRWNTQRVNTEFAQTHKPQNFEEVKTKDEPTLLQDPPLDFQLCLCGWNLWHHPCCTQVLFSLHYVCQDRRLSSTPYFSNK